MSAVAMLDLDTVSIAAATSFVAQAAAALVMLLTPVGVYIRFFTLVSVNTSLFGRSPRIRRFAPVHSVGSCELSVLLEDRCGSRMPTRGCTSCVGTCRHIKLPTCFVDKPHSFGCARPIFGPAEV